MKKTDYDLFIEKQMKNKEFKEAYEKEYERLSMAYELTQLRKKAKMTREEVAEKVGTSSNIISRIENGKQNFSLDMIMKLANVFNKHLEIRLV